jgi:hypothetical protein
MKNFEEGLIWGSNLSRLRGMMNIPQFAALLVGVANFDTAGLAARSFIDTMGMEARW